jgi:hypothetical protein
MVSFDYAFVYLAFWVLSAGIFYSFMRLTFYGALAHETITLVDFTPDSLESLRKRLEWQVGKKGGMTSWFSAGVSWNSRGFRFSMAVGLLVGLLLLIVLFVKP